MKKKHTTTTAPTTGIDIIDKLPPDERRAFIKRTKAWWQSLTREQNVEQLDNLHQTARVQKADAYFCKDCHDRKPGACTLSPFQIVMRATMLNPLESKKSLLIIIIIKK